MNLVFSLASKFITWCPPTNPNLNLTVFPSFNLSAAFPGQSNAFPGETATVQLAPSNANATHLALLSGLDTAFISIGEDGTVTLPENLIGQVYAVITSSGTEVSDKTILAGPEILLFERFSNGTLIN